MFGRRDGLDATMSRDDLASFVAAASAVNQPTDLDSTLESILTRALELLGADEGSVMLLDAARTHLRIAVARGIAEEVSASVRVAVGEGISGYVAASGEPVLLDSGTSVTRYAEERRRGLRSAVSVPLRADGRVLGVLNLNVTRRSERPDLTEQDLALASLFAEFAAAAVRNATLVRTSQQRSAQLAQLLEASHDLSEAIEPEDVAERMLAAARDILPARGGVVFALTDDAVDIAAVLDVPIGLARATRQREGFAELVRTVDVEVVEDLAGHPVLAPLARRGAGAVVASLRTGAERRGLVVALLDRPRRPGTLETWTTYTHHAAFALTRAVLFRDVRAKDDELSSLTTAVPDPVVVLDANGRISAVNPAASELFGFSPAFDVGRPVAGRLGSPALEALVRSPDGGAEDVTLHTPEPRVFHARVVPVRAGAGAPGSRILSLGDVTNEREMDRIKADFVAVLGHELRTPLTMIKGYSQTLRQRGDQLPPEGRAKAFGALHEQTLKLERLIEDLLLVSRVERDRPPLHVAAHDLGELVRTAAASAVDQHPEHRFDLTVPDAPVTVELDAVKLQQVLHHLIDNACKFSERGTTVRVDAAVNDGRTVISVADEGIGIFSGDVPTLFDRFRQVDGSATRQHGGTGVGLHICKTLVEAHGGTVSVRSALGRGTTVTVRIPVAGQSSAEPGGGLPTALEQPVPRSA